MVEALAMFVRGIQHEGLQVEECIEVDRALDSWMVCWRICDEQVNDNRGVSRFLRMGDVIYKVLLLVNRPVSDHFSEILKINGICQKKKKEILIIKSVYFKILNLNR